MLLVLDNKDQVHCKCFFKVHEEIKVAVYDVLN